MFNLTEFLIQCELQKLLVVFAEQNVCNMLIMEYRSGRVNSKLSACKIASN